MPAAQPIAEELAKKQRDISVSEFFERNKQILGFDSPTRALITAVKEAVDNALDACEEAGILPDLRVELNPVEVASGGQGEYELVVEDNGPGIVKKNIGNVFARLLYGSRFHAIRQARGQQGIGISAVVLYGQLTTGKHALVTSKIGKGRPAFRLELALDTKKNEPEVVKDEFDESWPSDKDSGTRVAVHVVGRYVAGKQSVFEYLRSTSIVNPHARISYKDPAGQISVFQRVADELPPQAVEIKPHPHGVELGTLIKMARESTARTLGGFLKTDFVSVGSRTVADVLAKAKVAEDTKPRDLTREQAKVLLEAFATSKVMAPPTNCLSPIGDTLVKRGLKKETEELSPEFIVSHTRPPAVHSGHPFQVEVGIVFGGTLPKEEPVRVSRFANRVPLLYQQGGCALTKAIEDMDWRRYGLEQRGGKGLPVGPAIFLVHIASTKVPFTSESKEAVAEIEEILSEVKLAFRDVARHMGRHLAKQAKRVKIREKFILIAKVLPKLAEKSAKMLAKPVPDLTKTICQIMDVVLIEDSVEWEKLGAPKEAPRKVTVRAPTPTAAKRGGRGATKATAADGEDEAPKASKGKQSTLEDLAYEEGDAPSGARGSAAMSGSLPRGSPAAAAAGGPAGASVAPTAAPEGPERPREVWLTRSRIELTNYTLKVRKFQVFAALPHDAVVAKVEPKPAKVDPRFIQWTVTGLKPTEKQTLSFELAGLQKGDFDENELFVDGIDELHVVGAEPWHGGEE